MAANYDVTLGVGHLGDLPNGDSGHEPANGLESDAAEVSR